MEHKDVDILSNCACVCVCVHVRTCAVTYVRDAVTEGVA